MTRPSNLGTWIDIAKLGVAAGELAPFPYIKGLCGCAVLVLEAIEKAGKNNEDLLDLADSVQKTIEMVKSTVTEHGESSALRFRDVCVELEVYLTDLHFQLNSTQRNSRGIKRFLKTRDVSDTINGYQERVRAIKQDFLIRTAIDSRLVISDIKDELRASTDALTSAIETSRRLTMSNIENLGADVQTLKERGFYKGFIRDVPPGDIPSPMNIGIGYYEDSEISWEIYHLFVASIDPGICRGHSFLQCWIYRGIFSIRGRLLPKLVPLFVAGFIMGTFLFVAGRGRVESF
ncbi:hypothetical protein IW262DRAFT_1401291 [Armillaria fumosa]|nr:hypothetical protein IW262DRAFT_1401291 [Armillaria fumosa]